MSIEDPREAAQCYQALGEFMDAMSWLDHNMGLQLASSGRLPATRLAFLHKPSTPLKERWKALEDLAEPCRVHCSVEDWKALQAWLQAVDRLRALRGDLAHCRVMRWPTGGVRWIPAGWGDGDDRRPPRVFDVPFLRERVHETHQLTRRMGRVVNAVLGSVSG